MRTSLQAISLRIQVRESLFARWLVCETNRVSSVDGTQQRTDDADYEGRNTSTRKYEPVDESPRFAAHRHGIRTRE